MSTSELERVLNDNNEAIKQAMRSIVESASLQSTMQSIVNTAKASLDSARFTDAIVKIANPLANYEHLISQIKSPAVNISEAAAKFAQTMAEVHLPLQHAMENFQEHYAQLPEKVKSAIILIANHGWYFDIELDMDRLWPIVKALENGEIADVEIAFADYIEGKIDHIQSFIISQFSNRANIITKAFEAHKSGEYELSVPVLLAQADGMCKERLNGYLFRNANRRPQTSEMILNNDQSEIGAAFKAVFTEPTSINLTENQRQPGHGQLNRHEILHGDSVDYPTRINSLKSISLVYHVAQIVQHVEADSN